MTIVLSNNPHIMLVEDDAALASLISEYLSSKQYQVSVLHDGQDAVEHIIREQPDLVILDLMLPGKDGISICREIRYAFHKPIMILTASHDDIDHILGLEIGADDFVKKPIEPRILLARLRALLRRSESLPISSPQSTATSDPEQFVYGALSINLVNRSVNLVNKELELTTPEFDVLSYLAQNAGKVISRDELFQQLRHLEYDGQNRFIDITISHLRKKLGVHAEELLKTVRGKGYLFLK